jgi:hypothetical protein
MFRALGATIELAHTHRLKGQGVNAAGFRAGAKDLNSVTVSGSG